MELHEREWSEKRRREIRGGMNIYRSKSRKFAKTFFWKMDMDMDME